MIKSKIDPQSLLSTLWIFILLNMIFRDLHEFLKEGFIEELISLKVSEEEMLFYGFILELPILMVLLSKILSDKVNKWANISVAGIIMLGMLSNLHAADMDDFFFTIANSVGFLVIISIAWKLPSKNRIIKQRARQ